MERIKLALWKNDKRESATHPPLKCGKPVEIDGKQYWISAYINGPKDNAQMEDAINRMIDKLAELNGSYPIVSISLTPVDGQQYQATEAPSHNTEQPPFSDEIPFAWVVAIPSAGLLGAMTLYGQTLLQV